MYRQERREPWDTLGYGLAEFPLLLLSIPTSEDSDFSCCLVSCYFCLSALFFSVLFPTVHPTGRAARKVLQSKKKEKKKGQMTFAFCRQN